MQPNLTTVKGDTTEWSERSNGLFSVLVSSNRECRTQRFRSNQVLTSQDSAQSQSTRWNVSDEKVTLRTLRVQLAPSDRSCQSIFMALYAPLAGGNGDIKRLM